MSHLLFYITVIFSKAVSVVSPELDNLDINMKYKHTVNIENVPHHVLVAFDNIYCSGSLIYSRIVLTVASCFIPGKKEKSSVKIGANSIPGFGEIIPVIERKVHEYFNYEAPLNNDIALLILERSVTFNAFVKKAILIEPDVTIKVGTNLDVVGWGSRNVEAKYTNLLLLTEMKVISDDKCSRIHGNMKTYSKYCARYHPSQRLSDNGGSAMANNLLVGIVSYGATNTKEEECVALITNVSHFHRWIVLNSQRLLTKHCVGGATSDKYYSNYLV